MLKLNANMLHAAAEAAGVKDVRYYLNGVLVEFFDGQINYTATNGHILFTCWETVEESKAAAPVIIRREDIKAIKKADRVTFDKLPDGNSDDYPAGRYQLGDRVISPIDGRYPHYRRIIPESVTGEPGNLNPALVWTIRRAFNRAQGLPPNREAITDNWELLQNGPEKPAVAVSHAAENMLGVVMPHVVNYAKADDAETALTRRMLAITPARLEEAA